ncbi:3'-5' exonuclease [Cytophagales bacterium LB-30]|uniref:3'-5' exonuclease n=1 Tax=Shiella aurantiaca TaxID=3058365 RepID=A0ABT8F6D4_9BACT|nr:3'-5' exonuclease [Shiella aurantiaca]MDN4166032.1 3'-5' exonuclease [Shiella aurantiaca]
MEIPLSNILFLDIETVSGHAHFHELSPRMQEHWKKKAALLKNEDELLPEDLYFDRAAIYAEFGKVLVIGLGFMKAIDKGQWELRIKSLASEDEASLLQEFAEIVNKFDQNQLYLCAHNGKEFDFPYLCRRMLVNGVPIPESLQIGSKKPWEVRHLDTMELWKFGDRKNFTSLDLLASLFGIESSKQGIDGSQVNPTWYKEKNLEKIKTYCAHDVVVLSQLYLKLNNLPLISPEHVHILN